jgi:hypothetical protein
VEAFLLPQSCTRLLWQDTRAVEAFLLPQNCTRLFVAGDVSHRRGSAAAKFEVYGESRLTRSGTELPAAIRLRGSTRTAKLGVWMTLKCELGWPIR